MENVSQLDAATQHFLNEVPQAGTGDVFGGGGGSEPVVTCVLCQSQLALKTRQSGEWMISCQGYPTCRAAPLWLPSYVVEASVTDQSCSSCPHSPKYLKLVVKRSAMAPFYPDSGIYCLAGCDSDLLSVLQVQRLNSGHLAQPSQLPGPLPPLSETSLVTETST